MLLVIVSRRVNSHNRFRSFPQPASAPRKAFKTYQNLPSSWPCHQDSRSSAIHGARPSKLGFVPSAVGLYEKKTSPVPTSPDLDKGPPKLVFCRDSPSTIHTRDSELGRHRMPSHPEAANRTGRPCDSGNVFKGPVPGYLGRGPPWPEIKDSQRFRP